MADLLQRLLGGSHRVAKATRSTQERRPILLAQQDEFSTLSTALIKVKPARVGDRAHAPLRRRVESDGCHRDLRDRKVEAMQCKIGLRARLMSSSLIEPVPIDELCRIVGFSGGGH